MQVALISLDQCWENKAANKIVCSEISHRVMNKYPEVDIIIYPEMTLTGFSMKNPLLPEPTNNSVSMNFFKQLSESTKCTHVFGHSVKENEVLFNRCSAVNHRGHKLAAYDKMHTFSFAGESNLYSRGNKVAQFEVNQVNIGLSICFDLRFPELYGCYRESCEMVINIANWPASRKEHWDTLLRARSIENQYYMIGVNRIGVDGNNIEYQYSSAVYNPLGELCAPIFKENGIDIYDLDLGMVDDIRNQFPFINDRRNKIYKKFN